MMVIFIFRVVFFFPANAVKMPEPLKGRMKKVEFQTKRQEKIFRQIG